MIYSFKIKYTLVHDNTQPSARMGRKAYRVSPRQPGCRNITHISAPAVLFLVAGIGTVIPFRKPPNDEKRQTPEKRCRAHLHFRSWLHDHGLSSRQSDRLGCAEREYIPADFSTRSQRN